MKDTLTIEGLRKKTDDALRAVFKAIDAAPGVAIIGDQFQTDSRKWVLLGDNRKKYAKHVKECDKLIAIKEDSFIPNKKDKISLKAWDKQIERIFKMAK